MVGRLPGSECWRCGYRMDAASAFDASDPRPAREGDPSVCLRCGAVAVFTAGLELRKMTPREVSELDGDTKRDLAAAVLAQRSADPLGWWRRQLAGELN